MSIWLQDIILFSAHSLETVIVRPIKEQKEQHVATIRNVAETKQTNPIRNGAA